jgi:hypothetical protein
MWPFCERYTIMLILVIMTRVWEKVYTMYMKQVAEDLLFNTRR